MDSPYSSDEIDDYLGPIVDPWYDDGDGAGDETDDDDISGQLYPSSDFEALQEKLESTASVASVVSSFANPEMISLQLLVSQLKEQGSFTDETQKICAAIINHPMLTQAECVPKFTQISDASRYVKPNEITLGIYLPRRRLPRRDDYEWAQDSPILLVLTQTIPSAVCGMDSKIDTPNPTPNSKRGLHFCGRDTFIAENTVVMRYGQDKNRNIHGRQFQIIVPRVMKCQSPTVDPFATLSHYFDDASAAVSIESVLQGLDRDHKIDLLLSILNEYQDRRATASTQSDGGRYKRKGSLISLISPELITGSDSSSDFFLGCQDADTHDPHSKRMTRGGNLLTPNDSFEDGVDESLSGSQLDSCILSALQHDAQKNADVEDVSIIERQIKDVLKLFGASTEQPTEQPEAFKGDKDSSVIYNCQFRFASASPLVCRTESISDSNSDSSDDESRQVMFPVLGPHTENYVQVEEDEEEEEGCSEEESESHPEEEDDDFQIMFKSIQITNQGHEDQSAISTGANRNDKQSKKKEKPMNEAMKTIKADFKKSDVAVKKGAKKAMKKLKKIFS